MRTRLMYQLPTESIDEDGGKVEAWADQFAVWARVQQLSGEESVSDGQIVAHVKHQVSVRRRGEFAPAGRFVIVQSNRILNIEGVLDAETRGAVQAIACVERVGETA